MCVCVYKSIVFADNLSSMLHDRELKMLLIPYGQDCLLGMILIMKGGALIIIFLVVEGGRGIHDGYF